MRDAKATGAGAAVSFRACGTRVGVGRRVPIVGAISGGAALHMLAALETVEAPPSTWQGRRVFALRVRGSALSGDGIRDGDCLLVQACERVGDGQLVVAEVNGKPTVRRLYRERDGSVGLQPPSDAFLPFVLRPERLRVRGVVVGLMRKSGFARVEGVSPSAPRALAEQSPASPRSARAAGVSIPSCAPAPRAREPRSAGARARDEIDALGRTLRILLSTYATTGHPRLRAALLEEASRIRRRMRGMRNRSRNG